MSPFYLFLLPKGKKSPEGEDATENDCSQGEICLLLIMLCKKVCKVYSSSQKIAEKVRKSFTEFGLLGLLLLGCMYALSYKIANLELL